MANAIVHIGFNKCGSTAIQKWLADNTKVLREHGYSYRRTDPRPHEVCSNPQFLDLAFSLLDRPLPPRPMTKVLGYTQGNLSEQKKVTSAFDADYSQWITAQSENTVLISNEFLAPWLGGPRLIQALDGWLTNRFESVRYVVYLREPMAWFVSLHGHHSRTIGSGETLVEFIERLKKPPFARQLKIWRDALDPARLEVRLFQEAWLQTHGLIEDYLGAIGLSGAGLNPATHRMNTSYNAPSRGLREILKGGIRQRPRPPARLRKRLRETTEPDLQWIQENFFSMQPAEFSRWAAT